MGQPMIFWYLLYIRKFLRGFYFHEASHIFVKIKSSRNGGITLSLTDIGKSCPSHNFLMSQICGLMLFAKISEFTVSHIHNITVACWVIFHAMLSSADFQNELKIFKKFSQEHCQCVK